MSKVYDRSVVLLAHKESCLSIKIQKERGSKTYLCITSPDIHECNGKCWYMRNFKDKLKSMSREKDNK